MSGYPASLWGGHLPQIVGAGPDGVCLNVCLLIFFGRNRIPITVPVGLADFPHELFRIPEPWIHSRFLEVVQYTEMPRGGHFAAFEEPDLFANDVIQFVEKVEKRIVAKKAEELKETTA